METIIVDIINATLLNPNFWNVAWIVSVAGAAIGMLVYGIYQVCNEKCTEDEECIEMDN